MATRGGWVRRGAIGAVVVICLLGLAALFAPYVYAELMAPLNPHAITDPQPAVLAKGHMVDDYFAVEPIGPATFAIGEPRYYQQNYAYLIIGQKRAVLFDSGSGTRDIGPVVRSLTRLPVTVIVSHLHFDHLGGIGAFGKLDMIDLPQTRADFDHGRLHPKRYEFMGFEDGLATPSPTVEAWLKPGESLDLGGRSLAVLSTPGHTPSSVALYEPAAHRLFIGDFIYPTTLYAFLPGRPFGLSRDHQAPAGRPARRHHPLDGPLLPRGRRDRRTLARHARRPRPGPDPLAPSGWPAPRHRLLPAPLSGEPRDDHRDRVPLEQSLT